MNAKNLGFPRVSLNEIQFHPIAKWELSTEQWKKTHSVYFEISYQIAEKDDLNSDLYFAV